MNYIYFFGGLVGGFLLIIYSKAITDSTGRVDFAEKYLGMGGTYSFWKLIGFAMIIFSFWAVFNM
ncbi:MAG TPA: hypothetical protein PK263_03590 [bacterium]|nr:hypothetical protein [bacterium]